MHSISSASELAAKSQKKNIKNINLESNTANDVDMSEVAKMQKKMTLVFHAVRFPDPALSNQPEYFGLGSEYSKRIMSLGRIKLFPDEVLEKVFGEVKDSPIQTLKLVRSRLQNFIDQYSFPFMNGMARSIPNEKLAEFNSVVKELNQQFHDAMTDYLGSKDELMTASKEFWKKKSSMFDIPAEAISVGIQDKIMDLHESDFHFEVTHFAITVPESIEIQTMNDEEIEMLEARQEVVAASMKDLQISMEQFQAQVIIDLRVKYQQAFEGLLHSLKAGKFNQKSINSVLKMCDEFKNLNIMEDKTLEGFVETWKAKLKEESAKSIKTDEQINKEFSMFLAGEIKKLEEIKDEAEDFGETITREVDPF